jgi:hypothetical protein
MDFLSSLKGEEKTKLINEILGSNDSPKCPYSVVIYSV